MRCCLIALLLWLSTTLTCATVTAQEILLDLNLRLDREFNFAFDPTFGTGQPPQESGVISIPGAGRARFIYSGSRLLHPNDHSTIEFQFEGHDDLFLPGRPVEADGITESDDISNSRRVGQPFRRTWIQAFEETDAGLKVTCTLKPYSPPNSRTADGATYPRQETRLTVEWIGADQPEVAFKPILELPISSVGGSPRNSPVMGKDIKSGVSTTPGMVKEGEMVRPADPVPAAVPATVAYTAPGERYRIPLPSGWSIRNGWRGKLPDADFDTVLNTDGSEMVICRRQPEPATDLMDALDAFRERQLRLTGSLELRDVRVVGYSTDRAVWMQVSYLSPESGTFVAKLATVQNGELLQFEFLSERAEKPDSLPESLQALQASIAFSGERTAVPQSIPPESLPANALRIVNRLDERSRMIGVRTESAGRPAARSLGIESPTGSVVLEIFSGLPAAAAGLRRGDLVVQLGDHSVENREDFEAAVFTAPIGSLQNVTYVRGMQRQTRKIRIEANNTDRTVLKSYISPDVTYRLRYLPNWTMHPTAQREESTGKIYDYLESSDSNYHFRFYHEAVAIVTPVESLKRYVRDQEKMVAQSQSGWIRIGDIPAAYVSGAMTQERQFTVYWIAFVIQSRMHTLQILGPPLNDPSQLPFVVQTILGTIEEWPPDKPGK